LATLGRQDVPTLPPDAQQQGLTSQEAGTHSPCVAEGRSVRHRHRLDDVLVDGAMDGYQFQSADGASFGERLEARGVGH